MLEGANFILLKGLWDAHGVSCRAAEPIGRSLHSLQDARYACYRGLIGGLVFLFPSDVGFVGYYLFRCFYMLFCEISPIQGCFVLYPFVS